MQRALNIGQSFTCIRTHAFAKGVRKIYRSANLFFVSKSIIRGEHELLRLIVSAVCVLERLLQKLVSNMFSARVKKSYRYADRTSVYTLRVTKQKHEKNV